MMSKKIYEILTWTMLIAFFFGMGLWITGMILRFGTKYEELGRLLDDIGMVGVFLFAFLSSIIKLEDHKRRMAQMEAELKGEP